MRGNGYGTRAYAERTDEERHKRNDQQGQVGFGDTTMELIDPSGKPIKMPYHGTRTSYRCYHPSVHYSEATKWLLAKKEFMRLYKEWLDVCELYEDEQKLSEPIVSNEVRRDILKLMAEIEKELKNEERCYIIEALANALWDKPNHDEEDYDHVGNKCETHYFPTMSELKKKATEYRAQDSGLTTTEQTPLIKPVKRSWAS